jgi:hypothetical protein
MTAKQVISFFVVSLVVIPLMVWAAPDVNDNVDVTNITSSSFDITGYLDNTGESDVYMIGYWYGVSPSFNDTLFQLTDGAPFGVGSYPFTISGLECNVQYDGYFWALNNDEDTDDESAHFSATTGECGGVLDVSDTVSISNLTSSSFTLTGEILNTGSSDVHTVGFNYGIAPAIDQNNQESSGPYATGTHSRDFSSLYCATEYIGYFFAVNSDNPDSDDISTPDFSFTTNACDPPTATTDAASSIGATSATLNGTINHGGFEDIEWVGFHYGLTTSYGSDVHDTTVFSGGAYSLQVTSLTPCTTYHFRAYVDYGGDVYPGEDATFDTECIPVFSSVAPASNSKINTITDDSDISYTLNQNLTSGFIEFTRTGGTTGPDLIRCDLIGDALLSGAHENINLSDGLNVCDESINIADFVSGAIYTVVFDGENGSGGADAVTRTNVTFDTTVPTITNVDSDKADGSYKVGEVIDIDVEFSEAVYSASNVTITLETGVNDRTCTFTLSNESSDTCNYTVQSGDTSSDLTVKTISGSIYDAASNFVSNFTPATNLSGNRNIVIDTTVPVFSSVTPTTSSSIDSVTTSSDVSYSLSEAISSGSITITRTGGSADPTVHTCTLVGTALNSGSHTINLSDTTNGCSSDQSGLVEDSAYTFVFDGSDVAGNGATDITSTSVTFDAVSITSPTVTTSSASSITTTTATLNGQITATGNGDATQHGFAYGTDSGLSTVIATTTIGSKSGTGAFTSSVSSLSCGTTYYSRAYATNSAGTGYGSVSSFVASACPVDEEEPPRSGSSSSSGQSQTQTSTDGATYIIVPAQNTVVTNQDDDTYVAPPYVGNNDAPSSGVDSSSQLGGGSDGGQSDSSDTTTTGVGVERGNGVQEEVIDEVDSDYSYKDGPKQLEKIAQGVTRVVDRAVITVANWFKSTFLYFFGR